eukprot:3145569-Pyramimonas_sp.AAC.1
MPIISRWLIGYCDILNDRVGIQANRYTSDDIKPFQSSFIGRHIMMYVVTRTCVGIQVYKHVSVRGVASQDSVVEVTDKCDARLGSPFSMSYRVAVPIQDVSWYRQFA